MHLHGRTTFIGLIVVLTPVPVRAGSPRQISWRELSVATGKNVSVVMLGGAVISGKAVAVDADAMTVKVARTTDPRAYPKGEMRFRVRVCERCKCRPRAASSA